MIRADAGAAQTSTASTAPAAMVLMRRSIPAFNTTDRPGLWWPSRICGLELRDVYRLRALVALLLLVGDLRALGQRPVAVAEDAREVDEQVTAALVWRDEAETLVVGEPFDRPGTHR